jgi:hypothetical protein
VSSKNKTLLCNVMQCMHALYPSHVLGVVKKPYRPTADTVAYFPKWTLEDMDHIFGDTAAYEEKPPDPGLAWRGRGRSQDTESGRGQAGLTSGNDTTSGLAGARGRRGVCGSCSLEGYMGLGELKVEQYVVCVGG